MRVPPLYGFPMNATALQSHIEQCFSVFTGPPRAFFELPTARMEDGTQLVKRVVYHLVSIVGDEDKVVGIACDAFHAVRFASHRKHDAHPNNKIPVFWRRVPTYHDGRLTFRIGFWDVRDEIVFCEKMNLELGDPGGVMVWQRDELRYR